MKKLFLTFFLSLLTTISYSDNDIDSKLLSIFGGKDILIKPLSAVKDGVVSSGNRKTFTATMNKDGSWRESRHPELLNKPSKFKILSKKPLIYILNFSRKNDHYEQYTICDESKPICDYAVAFYVDNNYVGSSIGKIFFKDKDIFKNI